MKTIITLISTVCLSAFAIAQTYPIGHMSINFKDASRAAGGYTITGGVLMTGTGRTVGAEVYYPAVSAGTNVAVASGTFPIVVIGHGFVMTYDNYDNIYNALAAKGYIVALPRTEGSTSPVHSDFGQDLRFLSSQLLALNSTSTPSAVAIFNGKVGVTSAIGGHSMGGGCSFLAAANNATLTCLFNLAAANSNTAAVSSIQSASMVTVPTLVIGGQKDCVADTTSNQNLMYNNTASAVKFKVILKDITHCDFGNGTSSTCTLGQGFSGCGNTISNVSALNRYMTYLEPFLAKLLKNDCAKGQQFMDTIQAPSTVRVGRRIQGSIACITTSVNDLGNENTLSVFPNPTTHLLHVNCSTKKAQISLSNILGEEIAIDYTTTITGFTLDVQNLNKGIYFINVFSGNTVKSEKFIKL